MSYDQARVTESLGAEHNGLCESLTHDAEAYHLIIEHIDQGAAILAANGTILYANRRLATMLGLSLKDLMGSSLLQHLPPPDPALLTKRIHGSCRQKEHVVWRFPSEAMDKAKLHVVLMPLEPRGGASYSVLVTDMAPALEQEALRRSQTTLEQETANLTAAKQIAEQASRTKNIFLATMSHELRTPMNAIIGFNELLLMTEKDDNRRNQMNIIKEAGNSLLQLIRNMLDLSKIEAGQTTIYEENFVLSELIYAVVSMFEAQASSKKIALSTIIDPELPLQIYSDSGLLKQILINLIGNAVKFTNSGSVLITVGYSDESPEKVVNKLIIFHVEDTGIGIKPENIDRIFEVFEQEDGSLTRRFGGSGLGLSISKRLVTLLGGKINVKSTPGVGSHFSFFIPCKVKENKG